MKQFLRRPKTKVINPFAPRKAKTVYNVDLSECNRVTFAQNVDLDEEADNEITHLDLHCLPSLL